MFVILHIALLAHPCCCADAGRAPTPTVVVAAEKSAVVAKRPPPDDIRVSESPSIGPARPLYTASRAPLSPQPLLKLPIGRITPRGWLRTQLQRMADGLVGRLSEVSKYCRDDSGWLKPATGSGWEEAPYWLRGFGDLAYVLGDKELIAEAQRWTDAIIESQDASGYFGCESNKRTLDFWPNMLLLPALQSRFEVTGDPRVLPLLTKYFAYRNNLTDAQLFPVRWGEGPYNSKWWQHVRASDELESIYWLFNRTGDESLLKLATRIYRLSADWNDHVASLHGVNICQGFRGPAVYSQQTHDRSLLEGSMGTLRRVMEVYGQAPGGMFGADENCREAFIDPRQGAETCSVVELMHSYEYLLKMTGDADFADRCEEIAFNTLPATMTADLKAAHYLTAANMVQLDKETKAPALQNGSCMLSYSAHRYRCCTHNVGMGWPYFAEHLWAATLDGGLAAVMYAESSVRAKVADGVEVTVEESTDYPFDETIRFRVGTPRAVRFPLALRVPEWCVEATVSINGKPAGVRGKPRMYVILHRTWNDGDTVTLSLPMTLAVTRWQRNQNAASVRRGPLWYSLRIGERWANYDDPARQPFASAERWPAREVFPTTPWNYGLVLDAANPESTIKVLRTISPLPAQPFEAESAPVTLQATGARIDAWRLDPHGVTSPLQPSPVRIDDAKPESIELIPMGAARLRISAFPVLGAGSDARAWRVPKWAPHQASHSWDKDDVAAMTDDLWPKSSSDRSIPRFTWWPRNGTTEWVTYEFDVIRPISQTHVYWCDDTGFGACRLPLACRLYFRQGDLWKPVPFPRPAPIEKDKFVTFRFEEVKTNGLRLEADLQPGMSAGILEWVIGSLGPS